MNFKLENLSEEDVNLILIGLSELPYKITFELINKIQSQCEEQIKNNK